MMGKKTEFMFLMHCGILPSVLKFHFCSLTYQLLWMTVKISFDRRTW